ncbi:MAG: leucine-rich repeat protein [Sphingobacteriaceae bacterium]|nr:leucine-rich repeat protein [Sphingobacteriaceae bacterium]
MKNMTKLMSAVLFLVAFGFASCKNDDLIIRRSKMYTVTFETNGGSVVALQSVEDGKTLSKPTDPTKPNFVFEGWFKDPALTQAFDFATEKITANTSIYTKWKANEVTITLNLGAGTGTPSTVKIPKGATIDAIATPTKGDKDGFQGWYTDDTFTTKFNATQAITADMTLYAKWITFETEAVTGGLKIINFNKLQHAEIVVPATINGKTVVEISSDSYDVNNIINKVTLSEGLKTIGIKSFYLCKALTTITIPNSVNSIGDQAFYNCTALATITIPASVNSIGANTFYSCTALKTITIPASVNSIGNFAFYGCNGLTTINISDSVISIGTGTFNGCSALATINIPSSVNSIGNQAFYNCSKLVEVIVNRTTMPLTTLGLSVFNNTDLALKIKVLSDAAVTAYQGATNWSTYSAKIEKK